ncbi:MAG: FecR domain-containing protein [Bacteroidetes bacterium]|nr:FecR domain-containing protein [Bacteroidota bacterium]
MTDQEYWELMAKILAGEADHGESVRFAEWLDATPGNREMFSSMESVWKEAAGLKDIETFDSVKALARIKSGQIIYGKKSGADHKPGSLRYAYSGIILRIAAGLAILTCLGTLGWYALFKETTGNLITIATSEMEERHVILPDGTGVWLNSGSTIEYPGQFSVNKREVSVAGEAFFDVARNEDIPFVVQSLKATVTVLGTSFNINTAGGNVDVVVESGKVVLEDPAGEKKKILLEKGDRGYINRQSGQLIKKKNRDPNYSAWKTDRIIFENATMSEVFKTLEKVYHVSFTIEDRDAPSCRLTASFNNQPVTAVLEIIKQTLDLEMERTGSNYRITGSGCDYTKTQ